MIQFDTFSLLQQFAKTSSSLVGLLSNDPQATMVLVKIAKYGKGFDGALRLFCRLIV